MQREAGTTLRTALKYAVHQLRLIPHNPAEEVAKPRHEKAEIIPLDPAQVQRCLAAAKEDRLHAYYVLAVDGCAREGELFALAWAEGDFEGGAITITRTLEETKGKLLLKDVKSKKSRRRVALSAFTMEALAEHRGTMLAEGHYAPDKPVFSAPEGGWLRKSNFLRRCFQPILDRADAKAREEAEEAGGANGEPRSLPAIRPDDLRHTGATLLPLAGESPKVVSERLGHSTITLTGDTYAHVLPGMQERAASKFDTIFRAGEKDDKGGKDGRKGAV
jgi:integrase